MRSLCAFIHQLLPGDARFAGVEGHRCRVELAEGRDMKIGEEDVVPAAVDVAAILLAEERDVVVSRTVLVTVVELTPRVLPGGRDVTKVMRAIAREHEVGA